MRRTMLTATLLCLLLVGGTGCGGDAKRDDAGQVREQSDVSATKVRKGDCIAGTARGDVESLTAVPCDQPHGGEAYHAFDLPGGDYPGAEPIATAAEQGCIEGFTTFVGRPYEESVLEIAPLTPTAESWKAGDRQVLCFIKDPERDTTGSLANANR